MLHPQAVAAMELWAQAPGVAVPGMAAGGFGQAEIEQQRLLALAEAAAEPKEQVERVEDVDAGGVSCRLYRPGSAPSAAGTGTAGAVVYLHGGGFVFGEVETHDAQARRLANRTGSVVLSVNYRRPPEHRFPAAPDDVDAALLWLARNGSALGLDPSRITAVGDSAGGNLALVAALRNPDLLAATVLIYPFIDSRARFASYQERDGTLTPEAAGWYWQQYAAAPVDLDNPDLAPLDSALLATVPPTLVLVAEHDILRDEGHELVRRLEAAGVAVTTSTYAGMVHGFWRHPGLFDAAEESLAEIAAFLRRTAG